MIRHASCSLNTLRLFPQNSVFIRCQFYKIAIVESAWPPSIEKLCRVVWWKVFPSPLTFPSLRSPHLVLPHAQKPWLKWTEHQVQGFITGFIIIYYYAFNDKECVEDLRCMLHSCKLLPCGIIECDRCFAGSGGSSHKDKHKDKSHSSSSRYR